MAGACEAPSNKLRVHVAYASWKRALWLPPPPMFWYGALVYTSADSIEYIARYRGGEQSIALKRCAVSIPGTDTSF
jgi:hypothetical protein